MTPLQRFHNEVHTWTLLHRGGVDIVPLVGVCSTEAHPFALVYEHLDGLDLRQYLRSQPNASRTKLVLIPFYLFPLPSINPLMVLETAGRGCPNPKSYAQLGDRPWKHPDGTPPSVLQPYVTRFTLTPCPVEYPDRQRRHCPNCWSRECVHSPPLLGFDGGVYGQHQSTLSQSCTGVGFAGVVAESNRPDAPHQIQRYVRIRDNDLGGTDRLLCRTLFYSLTRHRFSRGDLHSLK